ARRVIAALAIPALLVGVAFGTFAPSNPEVQVVSARAKSIVGERNPYDDRPHIWAEARRQILLDPWTGQGAGAFPVVAARSGSETVTYYPEHAHNIWLTIGAELGIPAVAALLGLMVHVGFVTRRARRRARKSGRPRDAVLIACLAAAMLAVMGQGLIDYTLRAAVLVTEVSGVLGALLALARIEAAEEAAAAA
ncbi:MAG TPA: O-antigen ligase family protein, partial [Acidimicrobiales bacterium]|nr:O-antigen ligase family protein [Acidimicrobiales bacterium]